MNTIRNTLLASAVALGCASAMAAEPPQASIPFVNQRSSILSWQADEQKGIWIQDARKDWFYAKLQEPCTGLDFATSVAFVTATTSTLDKFGYVQVPGQGQGRCPITSLTKSDAPPDKKGHKPHAAEPAKAK